MKFIDCVWKSELEGMRDELQGHLTHPSLMMFAQSASALNFQLKASMKCRQKAEIALSPSHCSCEHLRDLCPPVSCDVLEDGKQSNQGGLRDSFPAFACMSHSAVSCSDGSAFHLYSPPRPAKDPFPTHGDVGKGKGRGFRERAEKRMRTMLYLSTENHVAGA